MNCRGRQAPVCIPKKLLAPKGRHKQCETIPTIWELFPFSIGVFTAETRIVL